MTSDPTEPGQVLGSEPVPELPGTCSDPIDPTAANVFAFVPPASVARVTRQGAEGAGVPRDRDSVGILALESYAAENGSSGMLAPH